jgi:hypothetical protein
LVDLNRFIAPFYPLRTTESSIVFEYYQFNILHSSSENDSPVKTNESKSKRKRLISSSSDEEDGAKVQSPGKKYGCYHFGL